ncbi:hypothetical protein RFI_29322 [Reticulomyxa filosa]|uniref:Rab-GAP TBC domain-containing protein n=1 Tax=Reticulomyxa filosa TaxID=46433 RepID=X6M4V5_RETFI|nr:hypothetical protein RFI_29322 [Reticulomyxa filosa]|eukprot:ETO08070.1 hypothetical protein RFI_29322 [Reticulomyxa filosa]
MEQVIIFKLNKTKQKKGGLGFVEKKEDKGNNNGLTFSQELLPFRLGQHNQGTHEVGNNKSKQKTYAKIDHEWWKKYLAHHMHMEGTNSELKEMIRRGIPPFLRGSGNEKKKKIWTHTSGCNKRRKEIEKQCPRYYEQLVEKARQSKNKDSIMEKDLKRTFPFDEKQRNEKAVDILRQILTAYSQRNPCVGYCQSMNIVGALLLLFMDEEEAFWMLCTVVEDICRAGGFYYHESDLLGAFVDECVFLDLIEIKMPEIYQHLQDVQFNLSTVTVDWFLCLFVTTLPYETTLRVWDITFSEGIVMTFKTALAILLLRKDALLKANKFEDMLMALREPCPELSNADAFIKLCLSPLFDDLHLLIPQKRDYHKTHVEQDTKKQLLKSMQRQFQLQRATNLGHTCQDGHLSVDITNVTTNMTTNMTTNTTINTTTTAITLSPLTNSQLVLEQLSPIHDRQLKWHATKPTLHECAKHNAINPNPIFSVDMNTACEVSSLKQIPLVRLAQQKQQLVLCHDTEDIDAETIDSDPHVVECQQLQAPSECPDDELDLSSHDDSKELILSTELEGRMVHLDPKYSQRFREFSQYFGRIETDTNLVEEYFPMHELMARDQVEEENKEPDITTKSMETHRQSDVVTDESSSCCVVSSDSQCRRPQVAAHAHMHAYMRPEVASIHDSPLLHETKENLANSWIVTSNITPLALHGQHQEETKRQSPLLKSCDEAWETDVSSHDPQETDPIKDGLSCIYEAETDLRGATTITTTSKSKAISCEEPNLDTSSPAFVLHDQIEDKESQGSTSPKSMFDDYHIVNSWSPKSSRSERYTNVNTSHVASHHHHHHNNRITPDQFLKSPSNEPLPRLLSQHPNHLSVGDSVRSGNGDATRSDGKPKNAIMKSLYCNRAVPESFHIHQKTNSNGFVTHQNAHVIDSFCRRPSADEHTSAKTKYSEFIIPFIPSYHPCMYMYIHIFVCLFSSHGFSDKTEPQQSHSYPESWNLSPRSAEESYLVISDRRQPFSHSGCNKLYSTSPPHHRRQVVSDTSTEKQLKSDPDTTFKQTKTLSKNNIHGSSNMCLEDSPIIIPTPPTLKSRISDDFVKLDDALDPINNKCCVQIFFFLLLLRFF